jgi:energy-converting hydrogenase Eha subunit E
MVAPQSHKPLDRSLQIVHLKLETAGTKYVFLAFIAVLVLVGGIATIAPVGRARSSNDSNQAKTDTDRCKECQN